MHTKILHSLSLKLYVLILPMVILIVAASGTFSFFESQKALVLSANTHLAYKAEQLRDYAFSEWSVIEKLGLDQKSEYRQASEKSITSYAQSLIRSETEQILIFDSLGVLRYNLGYTFPLYTIDGHEQVKGITEAIGLPVGWFTGNLMGERRIGVVFKFESFNWTIAITELHSRYFSGLRDSIRIFLVVLLVSITIATILITFYISHVFVPLKKLTAAIEEITTTQNLSSRVLVEQDDEVGFIASEFNVMVGTLEKSRNKAIEGERETLSLLGRISDFRDEETGNHQGRISSLTFLFTQLLGMDDAQGHLLADSAKLHDIGKIAIPDTILLKPAKLTTAEFEIMKTHTTLGYQLLKESKSEALVQGACIAYSHHECWNGSGYPLGLAGENIPLAGRIVTIVDVFDALTSARPYKAPWSNQDAFDFIVSQRGTKFDPALVDLFVAHFSKFEQ